MKKLPLLTFMALGTVGILWACGGGGDDDDGVIPYDAGPDVAAKLDGGSDAPDPAAGMGAQFCDETLGVIRKDITNCCSPAEVGGFSFDLYKNIGAYVASCESTLETSIADHRTSPDPQNYAACINGFNAVFGIDGGACSGLDKFRIEDVLSPSCAGAFTGKGAVDAPCAGDFDCASGNVCIGYTDKADGKCESAAPQTGNCGLGAGSGTPAVDLVLTPGNPCTPGLYCAGGICQPQSGLPDSGCSVDISCNNGLCLDQHCNLAPPPGPRLGLNAYCHTTDDCNTGLFCDQEDPTTIPTEDGGAYAGATGQCHPSKASSDTCAEAVTGTPDGNASIEHECLGRCDGAHCQPLCTFP